MKRLAVSITLSLFFFGLGFCQTASLASPSATKDPSAIALAQKALTAMGGPSSPGLVAIGTFRQYGDNSLSYTARLYSSGTSLLRIEIDRPAGTSVHILNAGAACSFRPDGTTRKDAIENSMA